MTADDDRSMAARWEKLHEQPRFLPRYPHEQVVRWAFRSFARSGAAKPKLLDHGCGGGRHALFLAEEGFEAHACDVSRSGIEAVKARAEARGLAIDARVADDLSVYPDAAFDGVLSFGVLYYLPYRDAVAAIDAVHRILRPGGRFLCVTRTDRDGRLLQAEPAAAPFTARLSGISADGPSDAEAGMEMLFFPREEIERLFAGFAELTIDRMSYVHGEFADDDWVISATKGAR